MTAGTKGGMILAAMIGLACVATVGVRIAPAQPKSDYKLIIYDDEHLKGRSVVIREQVPDLKAQKFDNKSESLEWHATPGRSFVCFNDKNYEKPLLVLVGKGEVQDLGKQQRNALHSITSVKIMQCLKGKFPKGMKDVPKLGTEE